MLVIVFHKKEYYIIIFLTCEKYQIITREKGTFNKMFKTNDKNRYKTLYPKIRESKNFIEKLIVKTAIQLNNRGFFFILN